jgi:hypothetical protein
MSARVQVIERIEDDPEALEPFDVELWLLDVGVVRDKFHIRIEGLRDFDSHQCLGLFDMLMTEQKLAVQIGEVDSVKVDNRDAAVPCEKQVFEKLAAYSTCANK